MSEFRDRMKKAAIEWNIPFPSRWKDDYLCDYLLSSRERDVTVEENKKLKEVIRQYENALNRIVDETRGKARDIAIEAMTT